MAASVTPHAPPRRLSSWRPSARLRVALVSGVVGGGVGAGLSVLLGGCTTCATGQNVLGVGLLVGLTAMYGAWSGAARG